MSTIAADGQPGLKRVLGFWALVAFGVGDILGSGVYALVGEISGQVGNAAWISYVAAAVVAALTGLTYAELISRFPKAGGAAHFAHEIFKWPVVTFLVIFFVALSGLFSFATAAHTFSRYALAFTENASPLLGNIVLPMAYILVVSAITARGISFSSGANIICSIIEVAALVIIIFAGLRYFGAVDYLKIEPTAAATHHFGPSGVVLGGAALAFFAFVGFEDMANLAEESNDPEKDLPRALCLAVIVTSVIYCLIAVAAVSVIPYTVLAASKTPLVDVMKRAAPSFPVQIYAVVPAFAVFNTGLLNLLMASRLMYGMARGRSNQLPRVLSYVHPRWQTPLISLALAVGIVTVMVLCTTNVKTLSGGTTTFLLIVFGVLHAGLLRLKFRNDGERPKFKIWSVVPILGLVLCLLLLGSRKFADYEVAGWLTLAALVLFAINRFLLGHREVEAVD